MEKRSFLIVTKKKNSLAGSEDKTPFGFNYFHTPTYALVSYIIKSILIITLKHFIHL
jgi:hypothetical protein